MIDHRGDQTFRAAELQPAHSRVEPGENGVIEVVSGLETVRIPDDRVVVVKAANLCKEVYTSAPAASPGLPRQGFANPIEISPCGPYCSRRIVE